MQIEEDKVEFSEEELKQLLIYSFNSSQTIEEVIAESKEEKKYVKESFSLTKSFCSNVLKYGNLLLIRLNATTLQANILKLYSYIVQNETEELLNDLTSKIQNTKSDIKSQQILLKEIKRALLKLEKNKVATCNIEISELIECINKKQQLIMEDLSGYIKFCELYLKGIEYQGTNKNQEKLTELNKNIDNSIKTLGLRK